MSKAGLAKSFLSLIRKASADLDVEKLREDVRAFEARHADLSTKEKAERMVEATARKAAALGAAASLPPGWGALVAIGPELSGLLVLQSRLIVGLHLLYGHEPEPEERALEVLAGLASGAGIGLGRRLTARVAEEIAAKLVLRIAGREAVHIVPVLGIAASAAINYAAVRAVGRAAVNRVGKLYGPPEIPGKGPVLEARGGVS